MDLTDKQVSIRDWSIVENAFTSDEVENLVLRARDGELAAAIELGLDQAVVNGCPVGPEVVLKQAITSFINLFNSYPHTKPIGQAIQAELNRIERLPYDPSEYFGLLDRCEKELKNSRIEKRPDFSNAVERYIIPSARFAEICQMLERSIKYTEDHSIRRAQDLKLRLFTQFRLRDKGYSTPGWPYVLKHQQVYDRGIRGPGNYLGFALGRIFRDVIALIPDNSDKKVPNKLRGDFYSRVMDFIIDCDIKEVCESLEVYAPTFEEMEVAFLLAIGNFACAQAQNLGADPQKVSEKVSKNILSYGYLIRENKLVTIFNIAKAFVATGLFPNISADHLN